MEHETFKNNIISIYGDEGQKWLENLPNMVNDLATQWNLSDLEPVENLSYNYILSGFQGEQPIVLKLGHDTKGLNIEGAALKAFKCCGAVDVLDQTDGALLLERVIPGHSLKEFFPNRDDEAIVIASELIKKLHGVSRINQKEFPAINDWLTVLDKPCDQLGQSLIKARTLSDELLNTMDTPILLHGDLHHDNILTHDNNWKVIDPKGVMGELPYEVGCFIRNPLDDLPNHFDCSRIITNRINAFSKNLYLDPNRIIKWCFVQTVLSAVWMIEGNLNPEKILKMLPCFDLKHNYFL